MHSYQHILFIDIETVPLVEQYDTLSERMQIEWEKKARFLLKDSPEGTVAADVFGDKAGVFSEFAKVVCISFGSFQSTDEGWKLRIKSISNDNEKVLLDEFSAMLDRFMQYNKQLAFCGHNIKEFDVPFLCRRMLIHGMKLPKVMNLSGMKPWEVPHIDTMELWKFGDYKHFTSLALLAEILGIPTPKDDIDGSMVADVYYKEKDLNRIAVYCSKDVATSAKVFLRLKGDTNTDFEVVMID